MHYDLAFRSHSAALDTLFKASSDNTEVRRARLTFEGSINKALEYEFEFTFGETIEYADMYFAFLRAPYVDKISVGHFREPFGLEELTSSNFTVFMERSLTSAFGPGRNTGLMVQKQYGKGKLQAYAGVFRITDDLGSDLLGEGKHSFTGRLAYNPLFDTSNNKALHLGLALNTHTPAAWKYTVKTENEVHTSPAYINTGALENISRVHQIGGEFGYTKKRLTLQSEYVTTFARQLQQNDGGRKSTKGFSSFYALASFFLKGGMRSYKQRDNEFSAIALTERYEKGSLSGAWEVGLRFSQIQLPQSEQGINRMSDVTLGLNWYFNSTTRMMANYVLTRMSKNYWANALQFRIQLTF